MHRKRLLFISGLVMIASAAGVVIAIISLRHHTHPNPVSTNIMKNVVTKTLAKPSTTPLSTSSYASTAAANEPSYISLPTIGTAGYIQKVGIDQYGQMAAPTNVHLAGWYVNSLLPGQAGLSVIDGHVDGYAHNQGIFGRLNNLNIGDIFTITFGNQTHKSFSVKNIRLVDAIDVPSILFAHNPTITSQLTLITCGGTYDKISHTYDKRTIVTSSLML
ncbi:MAG TPA: class F sortase [Candidatus Saccharimonadia bacterium]|nr:class F sortase [Candidatus Saccharimonadia bacterium]